MEHVAHEWSGRALDLWHNASATDFAALMLSVIICGWFVSRYSQR